MKLIPILQSLFSHYSHEDLRPGMNYATCEAYLSYLRNLGLTTPNEIILIKEFRKFLQENLLSYDLVKISDGDTITLYSLDSSEELLESSSFKPVVFDKQVFEIQTWKVSQTLGLPFRHGATKTLYSV